MIESVNITKIFNAGKPNEHVAIDGVSLTIEPHQVTVLKGPSGSGKTTLLTILGCMARPTAGRVFLQSQEITSLPERFLTLIRRNTFGFVFQQYNLLKGITALENVMLPAYPTGEGFSSLKKRAKSLLELVDLSHKAGSPVEWLSGGEAQRVAMARALINNPPIIIADEPTAHLDTHLSREFMETIRAFKGQGKTILIASHDPIIHDCDVVDRVVVMRDGKVSDSRKS